MGDLPLSPELEFYRVGSGIEIELPAGSALIRPLLCVERCLNEDA